MKYWERTLDSFADDIITTEPRQSTSNPKYWYSSFDIGPVHFPSDPDFGIYGCGKSPEEARKSMADGIRLRLPTDRNKDHYWDRAVKWWRCKELGLHLTDPNLIKICKMWPWPKYGPDQYSLFFDYEIPEEDE